MGHVVHKKVEVFSDDESQYICIPNELKFSDNIKDVLIRKVGDELIITPTDKIWDSFFNNNENRVSDNFFSDGRDNDIQPERESFED